MKAANSSSFKASKFYKSVKTFLKRLRRMFHQPIFIALTVFGNFIIFSGAVLLYLLEKESNPHIHSILDTIWWAVSTVTTVGYGDVTPTTDVGKVIGIIMMIVGTALFWSYTALFADALISKDISDLEDELKSIQRLLSRIDQSEIQEKAEVKNLLEILEKKIREIKEKP